MAFNTLPWRAPALIFPLFVISGCRTAVPQPAATGFFRIVHDNRAAAFPLDKIMEQAPPPKNGLQMAEVSRNASESLHIVRIWTQEKPHVHAAHDSTVLLQKGRGTLYLEGVPVELSAGDWVMIPRGIPHYFVNQATTTYSQAIVIFSPPFDGQDIIPARLNP